MIHSTHRNLGHQQPLRPAGPSRYELAMAGTCDGLWDWNLDSDEIHYSASCAAMLGLADGNAADACAWRDILHPDDRASMLAAIDELTSGRVEGLDAELRLRHRDGHYVEVLARATLVRSGGRPARVVGTYVDLSRIKLAEGLANQRMEMLEMVAAVSTMMVGTPAQQLGAAIEHALARAGQVCVVDRAYVFEFDGDDGDQSSMSNTFEWCAVGVTPERDNLQSIPAADLAWWMEQLRSRGRIQLTSLDDLPASAVNERETLAAQCIRSLLVLPMWVDARIVGFIGFDDVHGERIWLEEEISTLQVMANVIAAALDKRRGELELQHSEERYRDLVESTSDRVWECDPELRYTYAQGTREAWLGQSPDTVLGCSLFDQCPPGEAERVRAMLHTLSANAAPINGLLRAVMAQDGSMVVLETHAAPRLGPRGELLGYRGFDRDVTARCHLQEQVRQAQKMEAVARLAGGVAQDLTTLLVPAAGYCDLLATEVADQPEALTTVGEVSAAVRRAGELVEQLRGFALRQPLAAAPVQLDALLLGFERPLRATLRPETVLRVEPAAADAVVQGNADQLKQMLMNLAMNAQEAMPGGGLVTISTARAALSRQDCAAWDGLRPGEFVTLTVRDHGVGIDPETRSRIFEPFYTTKPPGQGIGLGLATVYGIVKQHGGAVRCESEAGAGTAFTVMLPLRANDAKPSAA